MRTLFIAFVAYAGLSACTRSIPSRARATHGTCEATCNAYDYCKGDEDESRNHTCISECRSIFSEDGRMDETALLNLQRLECPDLLAFIEGPEKRAIGTP